MRDRLAFATIKANGNASITVQSLQQIGPFSSPPSTSSNINMNSIKSNSSVNRSPSSAAPRNVGLGLNLDASKSKVVRKADSKQNIGNQKKEPSLYDTIFGPAYSKMAKRQPSTPVKSTSGSSQKGKPQARPLSPHVRQGSSAQLEKIAFSPRLSISPKWRQGAVSPLARHSDALFAYPLNSPSKHRRESTGGVFEPAYPVTPSRHRMKNAGGSVLPNGHPASSLTQDLGIASGSTPRLRNASRDMSLYRHYHDDHHDQFETDRLAGLLTTMSEDQQKRWNIPPHSTSTFADPNVVVVTPRRKRRKSNGESMDGNEAAAHSLLDLAASPSPNHSRHQQHRFHGATPSLDRLVEHCPKGSPLPRRFIDDESLDIKRSHGSSSLSPPLTSIKQMNSPPMTPPRSDRHLKTSFDPESEDSSPCPTTPTRKGQMILLPSNQNLDNKVSNLDLSEPYRSMTDQDNTMFITETPRTPPPISAPTTPKAPGSNFCYGEFLHVSPSPQPRMRINSANGTPRLSKLIDTPTRGMKSQARFLDYGGVNLSDHTPLTELEMTDVLTPGKHHLLDSSPQIGGTKKHKTYSN